MSVRELSAQEEIDLEEDLFGEDYACTTQIPAPASVSAPTCAAHATHATHVPARVTVPPAITSVTQATPLPTATAQDFHEQEVQRRQADLRREYAARTQRQRRACLARNGSQKELRAITSRLELELHRRLAEEQAIGQQRMRIDGDRIGDIVAEARRMYASDGQGHGGEQGGVAASAANASAGAGAGTVIGTAVDCLFRGRLVQEESDRASRDADALLATQVRAICAAATAARCPAAAAPSSNSAGEQMGDLRGSECDSDMERHRSMLQHAEALCNTVRRHMDAAFRLRGDPLREFELERDEQRLQAA